MTGSGAGSSHTTRPLRIAMASYYLPSDSKIGSGWMAHRLANALVERGHSVTMFSPCSRPVDARYAHEQVELRGRLRVFQWAQRLRTLDVTQFDVFHAHGDDFLVPRRDHPVHVRTLHGSCLDEAVHSSGFAARGRMLVLGLTEVVSAVRFRDAVGVSRNSIRFYPWLRRVIPNGVDVGRFHPGPVQERDPTILFVGTYLRRKRGRLLQQAFTDYVLPRVPDATLWMVCDDAPTAPRVEVLGRLSDEELAERYRRAWVFCLPSSYEGFGVPYIEAMASGTPVVATPNAGAREVLEGGDLGVLSPVDELGRNLVRLLVDDERRAGFTDAPRIEARKRYNWPTVADAYDSLYRELIASAPSAG
ncbi:MAG: putative Glycosyl transferase group 1 [Actinomycetia bacterium]|nr:putative Glycosyl transferase group 1 [Actinomycetes bacterium]